MRYFSRFYLFFFRVQPIFLGTVYKNGNLIDNSSIEVVEIKPGGSLISFLWILMVCGCMKENNNFFVDFVCPVAAMYYNALA